jgi:hypothetical protein
MAEMQRLEEAEASLGEAVRRLPTRARVHYNHGMALQPLGDQARFAEQLVRLRPNAPGARQMLQQIQQRQNR